MRKIADILIVLSVIGIIALMVWFQIVRPCWTYDYTAAANVPNRCVGAAK